MFISPKYRKLNTQYNFDDYSSKGSAVHPSKKLHRNLYAIDGAPCAIESEPETSQAGNVFNVAILFYFCSTGKYVWSYHYVNHAGKLIYRTILAGQEVSNVK